MIDLNDISKFKLSPQWLAGFFDGEGCIGLYKRNDRKKYDLNIKLAQKDEVILAFVLVHFPEATIVRGHNVSELCFRTRNVQIKLLSYIKDYSIVKRTQVLLALNYLNDGCVSSDVIALKLKEEKFRNLIQ